MNEIKLIKLSEDYQSDPNIASPKVKIDRKELTLSFELNYFIFPFKEGQFGKIVFNSCYSYRLGKPNDEGFYLDENDLWNKENFPDLEWNCFYEAQGVPTSYIGTFEMIDRGENNLPVKLNHYVFFMKEATFECLAESYKLEIM